MSDKMEFVKLTEDEFREFAKKHPQANFYQTVEWGNLKKTTNWDMHLLGMKDNGKVIAGAMVLSKNTPIKRPMFYSPRGFLIDYKNYDLLREFSEKIKEYVKKRKGIFLKIDPYVRLQQRDLSGNIVEGGYKNYDVVDNLKKLGYKHFGFNLNLEALQPRWLFAIDTKDKNIDELLSKMDRETRRIIKVNERNHIEIREISYDELPKFKDITKHTGDRRNFIDRPLSYYQDMYNSFHDSGILKILFAELNTSKTIDELIQEKDEFVKDYNDRKNKHDNKIIQMNEKKYEQKQLEVENNIKRLDKKIKEVEDLKEKYGDIITLGGVLFLVYAKEVVALVGGSYKEFMDFQSAYYVYYKMIKYACEHGFNWYNFYGITGNFDESNPLYGLYSFKKDFGGEVVELIGEFDLIINKPGYYLYKAAFATYHNLKKLKTKLKK